MVLQKVPSQEQMSLYPGAFKECISVTAICNDFLPGGYSNYGAGCDIAAPGGDLTGDALTDNGGAECMVLSTGINPNGQMSYIYKHGTSMACPHVTGVIALGASYALKIGKIGTGAVGAWKFLMSLEGTTSFMAVPNQKLTINVAKYIGEGYSLEIDAEDAEALNDISERWRRNQHLCAMHHPISHQGRLHRSSKESLVLAHTEFATTV